MFRRTKIIATLGPATDAEAELEACIVAGLDVARINFSHGTADEHARRIEAVRKLSAKHGKQVGVLVDLQGPKIRIARFKQGKVILQEGAAFSLRLDIAEDAGDENAVAVSYKDLITDINKDDILLLDDGRIVLQVESVDSNSVDCKVVTGGELSNNKGLNRKGGGLSARALTEKDKADMAKGVEFGADYFAISFPRDGEDMEHARELVRSLGSDAGLIAKIERSEAVNAIDEIILASDAVMVARGDLGVEIGDAEVPGVQKHVIHQARKLSRAVITATQMMESMVTNTIPTRAEVSDVANAVLDGTDGVMLSEETAVGNHPAKVIEAMSRVCASAEKQARYTRSRHRVEQPFKRIDKAIAMATMFTANHIENLTAIIALTESGSTPKYMSRIRSGIPIFGLTQSIYSERRMTLYRGVCPIHFSVMDYDDNSVCQAALKELTKRGLIKVDDLVMITRGDLLGKRGVTNSMKILTVDESHC